MPVSFQEIVTSRIFNFIVGENVDGTATEIPVHEEAIAQLSEPLHILTKSGPEAQTGKVIWEDVSKDTFQRFVQYAYTGDYSIPKTVKRSASKPKVNGIYKSANGIENSGNAANGLTSHPSSPNAPNGFNGIRERIDSLGSDETPSTEARNGFLSEKLDDDGTILNQPTLPTKKNKKRAAREKAAKEAALKAEKESQHAPPEPETLAEEQPKPEIEEPQPTAEPEPELISLDDTETEKPPEEHILTADFHTLTYPLRTSRDNYEGTCEPSMDFEKDHSYSNVLLSHASLYVLGDGQLIDNLKALALYKLHKTLCTFELDSENIGDITDLARYAYSRGDKGASEGTGGLRGLVCQYMAIHAQELHKDAKFMNLLVGGGQIVQDFIKLQLQRVN